MFDKTPRLQSKFYKVYFFKNWNNKETSAEMRIRENSFKKAKNIQ